MEDNNSLDSFFEEDDAAFTARFDAERDKVQTPFHSPLETQADTEEENDLTIGSVAVDIVGSVFRGATSAAENILELGSLIPGVEYDIPDHFGIPLGESSTIAGQFIETGVQFALPFLIPGVGGLATASKLGKLVNLANPTSRAILGLSQSGRVISAAGLKFARRLARDTVGGAIVDFAAFDPSEGRLSDLLVTFPGLSNPVVEYLASDENDSAAEGRLKNVLEGAGLGIIFDSVISGLRGINFARKHYKKFGNEELAHRFAQKELAKLQVDDLATTFKLEHKEAVAVNSLISHMGIDRTKLHIGDGHIPSVRAMFETASGDSLNQTAFHSTKAAFDSFSSSFIRTKAALVHGHGLYFAAQKTHAERYLPGFSNEFFDTVFKIERDHGKTSHALTSFFNDLSNPRLSTDDLLTKHPDQRDLIKSIEHERTTDLGYLYQVEIPDAEVTGFWKNTSSGPQSEEHLEIFADLLGVPVSAIEKSGGRTIYARLSKKVFDEKYASLGGDMFDHRSKIDEDVTELLKARGIKGSVTENGEVLVVYDESIVKITDREGRTVGSTRFNENLIKWAGKTQIVDPNGIPKPLYHSTTKGFDTMDPNMGELGFHVGTREHAEGRIDYLRWVRNEKQNSVMPLFVRAENPLRLDDINWFEPSAILKHLADRQRFDILDKYRSLSGLAEKYGADLSTYEGVQNFISKAEGLDELPVLEYKSIREAMKRSGYDSVVYTNRAEAEEIAEDSYILFESNQVKSALGNNGEFGLDETSILKQLNDPGSGSVKGVTKFADNGHALIKGINNPDISTAIHEVFHVARRMILDPNVPHHARAGITDMDIRELFHFAEGRPLDLSEDLAFLPLKVDGEEKLARAFEGYIKTGQVPEGASAGFVRMFDKLSRYIRRVYRDISNSPLVEDIPKEIRNIFDRLSSNGVARETTAAVAARSSSRGGAHVLYQSEKEAISGAFPAGQATPSGKPPESYLNRIRLTNGEDIQLAVDAMYDGLLKSGVIQRSDKLTREELLKAVSDIVNDGESRMYIGDGSKMRLDFDYLSSPQGAGALRDLHLDLQVKRAVNRSLVDEMYSVAAKGTGASMEDAIRYMMMRENAGKLAQAIEGMSGEVGRMLQSHRLVPEAHGFPAHLIDPDVLTDKNSMEKMLSDFGGGDPGRGLAKLRAEMEVFAASPPSGRVQLMRSRKSGAFNMIMEYWMNSILSGPITGAVNAISGGFMTLLKPLEKFMGHMMTGRWSQARQDLMRYGTMMSSMTDALRFASRVGFGDRTAIDSGARVVEGALATSERAISGPNLARTLKKNTLGVVNLDEQGVIANGFDWLGKAINIPSRLLQSTDEFFKQLNYRSDIEARLYDKAIRDGMDNPEEIALFVREQVNRATKEGQVYTEETVRRGIAERASNMNFANPAEQRTWMNKEFTKEWDETSGELSDLAMESLGLAREATFTTPLTGDRALPIKVPAAWGSVTEAIPLLRFLTPFVRTPTNLIAAAFSRTPVIAGWDVLLAGRKSLMAEMTHKNEKIRRDAIGRFSTGMVFTAAAFAAVHDGRLSGGGPRDKNQLKLLEATGWRPYSVKVGGKWVSYNRIDPVSTMVGLMADAYETWVHAPSSKDSEMMDMVNAGLLSLTRNLTNKSYLKGIMEFMNAVSDERMGGTGERVAQTSRSLLASFVPTLSSQLTVTDDPYLREARNLTEAMARRTYGMSDSLPPRRDLFGKPILKNTAVGPDWLSPFAYARVGSDKVRREFARLGHGFTTPKPDRYGVDLTQFINDKGQDAFDRWLELHGEVKIGGLSLEGALGRVISSDSYQKLVEPPIEALRDPRVDRLNRVILRYRNKAYRQVLSEYPEVKQGTRSFQAAQRSLKSGSSVDAILELLDY